MKYVTVCLWLFGEILFKLVGGDDLAVGITGVPVWTLIVYKIGHHGIAPVVGEIQHLTDKLDVCIGKIRSYVGLGDVQRVDARIAVFVVYRLYHGTFDMRFDIVDEAYVIRLQKEISLHEIEYLLESHTGYSSVIVVIIFYDEFAEPQDIIFPVLFLRHIHKLPFAEVL